MRIVAISDTHGRNLRTKWEIPDGDILIHAGDATPRGKEESVRQFGSQMLDLPHRYKIFVAGNHDKLFASNKTAALKALTSSVIYLENELVELMGVRIWGGPSLPYKLGIYCWEDENIKETWSKIPTRDDKYNTDIVVTHAPPYMLGDYVPRDEHIGCPHLLERVYKVVKPTLHIYGHNHSGYGQREYEGVKAVNAALCNDNYEVANQPIVIDI